MADQPGESNMGKKIGISIVIGLVIVLIGFTIYYYYYYVPTASISITPTPETISTPVTSPIIAPTTTVVTPPAPQPVSSTPPSATPVSMPAPVSSSPPTTEATPTHLTICERDYKTKSIKCPSGNLTINKSLYSRPANSACKTKSKIVNTCAGKDVTPQTQALVSGGSLMFKNTFNALFGDPCVGTYKQIDIDYTCQ